MSSAGARKITSVPSEARRASTSDGARRRPKSRESLAVAVTRQLALTS
jgi:hypothetical protein